MQPALHACKLARQRWLAMPLAPAAPSAPALPARSLLATSLTAWRRGILYRRRPALCWSVWTAPPAGIRREPSTPVRLEHSCPSQFGAPHSEAFQRPHHRLCQVDASCGTRTSLGGPHSRRWQLFTVRPALQARPYLHPGNSCSEPPMNALSSGPDRHFSGCLFSPGALLEGSQVVTKAASKCARCARVGTASSPSIRCPAALCPLARIFRSSF